MICWPCYRNSIGTQVVQTGNPIRVIDISEFGRNPDTTRNIAHHVDASCRELGFLIITGHGVDPGLVDRAWEATRTFFSMSLEDKQAACPQTEGHPYGYQGFASEALAYSLDEQTPPDLKETFNVGPLEAPVFTQDPEAIAFAFAGNHWPDRPTSLRSALEDYYRALARLSLRVMDLFALALDLPEDYFRPCFREPISALRTINYPALSVAPAPGQLRAGAHTDYGTLTLLLQRDDVPGLQVLSKDEWVDVPVIPGSFVVNIGDLMSRWTNDRWVSTLHRVAVPPGDWQTAAARQSLVFFHTPDWDAEIAPLPTCRGDSEAAYRPVRAGPHLASKFLKTVQ